MKRFLLFAGGNYDRCGGMHDYHSAYETLEEAFEAAQKLMFTELQPGTEIEWYHILDTHNPDGYYTEESMYKRHQLTPTNP